MELIIHKVYNRAVHSYLAVLEVSPTREGEDPDIFVVKNLPASTGPDDAVGCPTSSSGQEVHGPCHYIGCPGGDFRELTDECLYREGADVSEVVLRLSSSAVEITEEEGGILCGFDHTLIEQTPGYYSLTASWCITAVPLVESSAEVYPLYLPCEETFFKISNPAFEDDGGPPNLLPADIEGGSPYQCFYISAFEAPLGAQIGDTFIAGTECYEILDEVADYQGQGDGCELIVPSLGGLQVEGPYSDYSACAAKLSSLTGSTAARRCAFETCYSLSFSVNENPDKYAGADQQYAHVGTFNSFPAYRGVSDPDWWIIFATYRSGLSTGWLVVRGDDFPSVTAGLYGEEQCGIGTEPGVAHPCVEGEYCYAYEARAYISACAGSSSSTVSSESSISTSESSISISESSISTSESSISTSESSISTSESSISTSESSISTSESSISTSESSVSVIAVYEPCDTVSSSSSDVISSSSSSAPSISSPSLPSCTAYLGLEPCFPHIFESCWFICESYVTVEYDIGDTINIRLPGEAPESPRCYRIADRTETDIGAAPDCRWPTVKVLPQPEEVKGPYADCLDCVGATSSSSSSPCTEYLELEPCFPYILESCWFICESYVTVEYDIGDTISITLPETDPESPNYGPKCYRIKGRKKTYIGDGVDCIWPTVVVLPQPAEVKGPYADCDDCCEYYRLSPCFPDVLEKCTFVAKSNIPFDAEVGDILSLDGRCYSISDCAMDTSCPDTWTVLELTPTFVSGPYADCRTCEQSSSSAVSSQLIAVYEPCDVSSSSSVTLSSSSIMLSSSSILPSSSSVPSISPSSSSVLVSSSSTISSRRLARYIPCDVFNSSSSSSAVSPTSSSSSEVSPTSSSSSTHTVGSAPPADSSTNCIGYWDGSASSILETVQDVGTMLNAPGCSAYDLDQSSLYAWSGDFYFNGTDQWNPDRGVDPTPADRVEYSPTRDARMYFDETYVRFVADGDLPSTGIWELKMTLLSPSLDTSWYGVQVCGSSPEGRYYRDQIRCGDGPEFIDLIAIG